MASAGALKEGYPYNYGPRYNNTLFRGSLSVTGTATVTLPLPMRFVKFPMATLQDTSPAGTDVALVTVGNISGSTFTIYCWKNTSSAVTTLIAATGAFTVNWMAWGDVTDNFVSGSY